MEHSSDVEIVDVESSGMEVNQNSSPVLRCDTPAPPELGVVMIEKEGRARSSTYQFSGTPPVTVAFTEENENVQPKSSPVTLAKPQMQLQQSQQQQQQRSDRVASPRIMRFYPGDIVAKREMASYNWQPAFGTVLKPSVGSEMARSPDRGSSSEFHVHWEATNRVLLTKASDVALVDRVLLRGQRVQGYDGRTGTVIDYEVTVSAQVNGTNEVVDNIPIRRLNPISPYVRGLEIIYHNWIGVITSIKRNVWFRLDGGVLFYVETIESDGFTKTDPFWGLGVACPGMRTRLPASAFKRAKWSGRPWRFFNKWLPLHHLFTWAYCTVMRTEVTQLEVKWLQQTPGTEEVETYAAAPPPKVLRTGDLHKVMVIGTPSFETIGINSVRKMRLLPDDGIVDLETWTEGFKKKYVDGMESFRYFPRQPFSNQTLKYILASPTESEVPVKVLLRHNLVTVKWNDGKVEKISALKIPSISPTADDGEFPMGLTVAPIQKDSSSGDKYGIVMESNELARARSRKVNIRWIVDGKDEGVSETSVFDIRPHHAYSMYHRGTIIFPRKSTLTTFPSAVVVDVNVCNGKMVVVRANDHAQEEVFPHQVIALGKRCHWSFFTRSWIIDDLVVPPYQLQLEFDPCKKLVDVSEQKWNILTNEDTNNPQDSPPAFPTLWDEPPFELVGFAPETHRYYKSSSADRFPKDFANTVRKEMEHLQQPGNIPEGIWIRCYENRLDLVSVLMVGPTKTPYDDGIFLFDLQLPSDFPASRPLTHYVSYTLEIHPLLSFDGNVCVSCIPWEYPETPDSPNPSSYLLYFLSRLQTLIFTPNPYFSHPSKQSEEGTERGEIKSRLYNQGVFIRVVDSAWNMLQSPHEPWSKSIRNHFASAMPEKFFNIEKWMNGENSDEGNEDDIPCYPLLPVPDGLKVAIKSRMDMFKKLSNDIPSVQILSLEDTTADSESYPVQEQQQAPPKTEIPADATRLLTPIAEITEPSSTSTFGNKLSNLSVPSDAPEFSQSLDSMKNVKQMSKKKFPPVESESEPEELELNQNAEPPTTES